MQFYLCIQDLQLSWCKKVSKTYYVIYSSNYEAMIKYNNVKNNMHMLKNVKEETSWILLQHMHIT